MATKSGSGRVRWAAVLLFAVAAATATVTLPRTQPDRCPGGQVVATVGDVTLCTHGLDAEPAAEGAAAPEAGPPPAIRCISNGTSGARVQAVYARPSGRPDRYASLLAPMTNAAGAVEHIVDRSAAQTGGERHVRWVTTTARAPATGCRLNITRVTVPASAATDFAALVDSLAAQGLDRHDRKYLVWVDSATRSCSGIATHLRDDRRGQENYNNTSVGYARVDDDCLSRAGAIETHELFHLLGAVQSSAPHVSPAGHCRDEYDLLCYDDDGAGPFRTTVVCPSTANNRRLDCHHDDYFSTAPTAGGYLATHWNAADSRYLEHEAPAIVPGPVAEPPRNDAFVTAPLLPGYAGHTSGTLAGATVEPGEPVHGTSTSGSSWYKWRPRVSGPVSVDTRGSAADTVLTVHEGPDLARLHLVAANDDAPDLGRQSRVTFTAAEGTTYRIAISGRGTSTAVTLAWGPPPSGMSDIPAGARYENAAGWSLVAGVIASYPDHTWRPRHTVTRGQGLAALWHMLDEPVAAAAHRFTDVPAGAPYRAALDWAVAAGVVPPPATSSAFAPRSAVTRSQMITWVWASVGHPAPRAGGAAPAFTDVPAGATYGEALRWVASRHLVGGYADGTFRPDQRVTRAQLARILFALAGDPGAWVSATGAPPSTVVF